MNNVFLGAVIVSVITFFLFNVIKALHDYDSSLTNSVSVCIMFVLVILAIRGLT